MWIKGRITSGAYCSPPPQNNPSSGSMRDTISGTWGVVPTQDSSIFLWPLFSHTYITPPPLLSLSLSHLSLSMWETPGSLLTLLVSLVSKSQGSSAFSGLGLWECITSLAFHMGSGDWTQALNAYLVPPSQFCCWMRHDDHSNAYKRKHLTGDLFTTSEVYQHAGRQGQ